MIGKQRRSYYVIVMTYEMKLKWLNDKLDHGKTHLTHLPLDKMAATFTDDILKRFSWMKILEFLFNFHWSLFLMV